MLKRLFICNIAILWITDKHWRNSPSLTGLWNLPSFNSRHKRHTCHFSLAFDILHTHIFYSSHSTQRRISWHMVTIVFLQICFLRARTTLSLVSVGWLVGWLFGRKLKINHLLKAVFPAARRTMAMAWVQKGVFGSILKYGLTECEGGFRCWLIFPGKFANGCYGTVVGSPWMLLVWSEVRFSET